MDVVSGGSGIFENLLIKEEKLIIIIIILITICNESLY